MKPVSLAEVRALFPAMPDEVFNAWLAPAFSESGWPYFAEDTILHSPTWRAHLLGRKPSFWSRVTWQLRSEPLNTIEWDERVAEKLDQLAAHWKDYKVTHIWRLIPSSPDRLANVTQHLREFNALPGSLICLREMDRWHVLDGHHRLAAVRAEGAQYLKPVQLWLGEHAA